MGFFKWILQRVRRLRKLLTATIVVDENHCYFVSFDSHRLDLEPTELVRLLLHYYATMLFNPDPSDPEQAFGAHWLISAMRRVLDEGISPESDILLAARIDGIATIVSEPPTDIPRSIVAELYVRDMEQRLIWTEFPRNTYLQQLAFSVLVLLQEILKEIGPAEVCILERSLTLMNQAYEEADYSDIRSLAVVPTTAYFVAKAAQGFD